MKLERLVEKGFWDLGQVLIPKLVHCYSSVKTGFSNSFVLPCGSLQGSLYGYYEYPHGMLMVIVINLFLVNAPSYKTVRERYINSES